MKKDYRSTNYYMLGPGIEVRVNNENYQIINNKKCLS